MSSEKEVLLGEFLPTMGEPPVMAYGGDTVYTVSPPVQQPPFRLVAPPAGQLTLRAPATQYRATGFVAPPARSSVEGVYTLPHRVILSAQPTPENFCYTPDELTVVRDQGSCGACWDFALCSMLADRVSVMTKGAVRTALSVRQMQECAAYVPDKSIQPGGCDGNDPYIAAMSLVTKGLRLVAESAYPRAYDAKESQPKLCKSLPEPGQYSVGVSSAYVISERISSPGDAGNKRNVENMKQHILHEGPIVGTFNVYEEFQNYDGRTIYDLGKTPGKNLGGHAIEIVGWGKEPQSGVAYWVCRNSWGFDWPQAHRLCAGGGFFFFKMGSNVCDIEAYCAGAIPVIFNAETAPHDSDDVYPSERSLYMGNCPRRSKTLPSFLENSQASKWVGVGLAAVATVGVVAGLLFYLRKSRKEKR